MQADACTSRAWFRARAIFAIGGVERHDALLRPATAGQAWAILRRHPPGSVSEGSRQPSGRYLKLSTPICHIVCK